MHWRRKWQPTPVFLPGESQGRIPGTGEPGGLPSMGSHRVGHDWSDLAAAAAAAAFCFMDGSVQFSCSVVSNSLWPHELQHARPPCPSPTPGVYPNSCPMSWWCHPAISSSVIPFSSWPQSLPALPASESFPMGQLFTWGGQSIGVSAPSKEHPGLISFRMDWLDLLAVQGTLKSHHSSKASILRRSAFFTVQLSHPIHDHWKNHSLDWMDLCWQSNVSAFEYAI